MDINEKVYYNVNCIYILDLDERYRYVNNRQLIFTLHDNLYEYFDMDFLE